MTAQNPYRKIANSNLFVWSEVQPLWLFCVASMEDSILTPNVLSLRHRAKGDLWGCIWSHKNLWVHLLLLTFFDNKIFKITLLSKMASNLWHLPINPNLKIQQFPLGMLILRQKYFVPPPPFESSTTHVTTLYSMTPKSKSDCCQTDSHFDHF